jgi:phosphoglycerol transferase MdoB-like AlkP superfamily enzyme
MNNNATPVETLFENAQDYSKTTLELFELNVIHKSAQAVSSLAAKMAVFTVVALFILIINIGTGLWIGELLGKSYYGFFAIAGFYAFLAILLFAFGHKWIKTPISNAIITQLLKQKIV